MAYVAKTDGSRVEIPKRGAAERMKDWKQVSELIGGGYVERVCPRLTPSVVMLVDEKGRLKGLRLNQHASEFYGDVIAGDAVIMTRAEARRWGWL